MVFTYGDKVRAVIDNKDYIVLRKTCGKNMYLIFNKKFKTFKVHNFGLIRGWKDGSM